MGSSKPRLCIALIAAACLSLIGWSQSAKPHSVYGDTASSTPTITREEIVTSSGDTDAADGGNGWGSHKLRIVRTSDDTVYTDWSLPGSDYAHRTWVLAQRTASGWQTNATGLAGREPANLLRGPGDQLNVLSWPNQSPAIWDSSSRTTSAIPGNWQSTDWPYAAAGIDPTGDIALLESICPCQGASPNTPGQYGWSYRPAGSSKWQYSAFASDYRYTYMFLFPDASGHVNDVGTRDVLWSELGLTQPAGAFGYAINKVADWQLSTTAGPASPLIVHEEDPTPQYQSVLAQATDVYVDTQGRTHVLYNDQGAASGGAYSGRHAIIQNGVVVKDVPNPVMYPNLSRIIQDTTGRFTILSVCGSTMTLASGLAGDTDGTQLSTPTTLQFAGAYNCGAETNNFIAAPRGGTPLADYVDGVFDSGAQWVYYRLQLRQSQSHASAACTQASIWATPAGSAVVGSTVGVGAGATGCSTPQYRYTVKNSAGITTAIQNYSAASSFAWNTGNNAGSGYQVVVDARNLGSTADSESSATMPYTLTAPGVTPTVTATPTATATASQSAGNLTGSLSISPGGGSYNVGDSFTAYLVAKAGTPFASAQATVSVSANLAVQSVSAPPAAYGPCNFTTYSLNPTPANPSFAASYAAGYASASCTMYTLTLKAVAGGSGSITITSGSLRANVGGGELFGSANNAAYTLNGASSTSGFGATATSTVTPTATPPPTATSTQNPNAGSGRLYVSPAGGTYDVGDTFTAYVVATAGTPFSAVSAAVTVSANLSVQSITAPPSAYGPCNFTTYTLTPSTTNPGFAASFASSLSASSCTVYGMTIKALSAGVGTITIEGGSIKAYGSGGELVGSAASGSYTVNAAITLTPTATPSPTPSPTVAPAPTYTSTPTATPTIVSAAPPTGTLSMYPYSGTYRAGSTFVVSLYAFGNGSNFASLQAKIAVPSNLTVTSLYPGNCGLNYSVTPTAANPSFAGTVTGGTYGCVVYYLSVRANASGSGTISFSSASMTRASDGTAMLKATTDGTYTIN